jgi:hypothetical protein
VSIIVPDGTVWTVAGAAVAWFVRTERKMARMLSRHEHEAICDKRQKDLTEKLASIQHTLECQDERSSSHRASISSKLTNIAVKIAVLQTRMGTPPTGDTGTHRVP